MYLKKMDIFINGVFHKVVPHPLDDRLDLLSALAYSWVKGCILLSVGLHAILVKCLAFC